MELKQRIHQDARLVTGDAEASALLECLVKNLFDPALDAHFIGKVCGAGRDVRDRLAAAVGPLKGYVTELRMIEAKRLVCETDLAIPEIGRQLGYPVVRSFRRVFKKAHQLKPSAMREQALAQRTETPDPVAAAAEALEQRALDDAAGRMEVGDGQRLTPRATATRLRARARLGMLDPKHAAKMRDRLRRQYPSIEEAERRSGEPQSGEPQSGEPTTTTPARQAAVALTHTDPRLETLAAGAVFARILELPAEDLRSAILDDVRLGTTTASDVLQQFCCGIVRWAPKRAVTAAELGVQLLELHREFLGEEAADWIARAWAYLARIQILAGDVGAADRTLGFAWEEAAEASLHGSSACGPTEMTMAPWAEIEVRRVEGMIHRHQARLGDATRVLNRAVELGRELESHDSARIQAVAERLELATFLYDAKSSLALCDELEALTDGAPTDPHSILWRGLVDYHRGKAYIVTGQGAEAEASFLRAAGHLHSDIDAVKHSYELGVLACFILHELARVEGRFGRLDNYDLFLRGVAERYQILRLPVLEVAAEAELAALCALRGQPDEARRLAAAAADFLDNLPSHRQAWNAARLLRSLANGGAEAAGEELSYALAVLCADLDSVRWEITGRQAATASEARRAGS